MFSTSTTSNTISTIKDIHCNCNLVELLHWRSLYQPEQVAFTFLQDGETESTSLSLTYQELDLQARKIATKLQSLRCLGEQALLMYPSGLEFITAFFGCLYAGVIAVPLYIPKRNQNLLRFQSIVADTGVKLALTTQSILDTLGKNVAKTPDLAALHWLATDSNEESFLEAWQLPQLSSDSLAFLQYTSGSTGTPKGVMVSHGNLLHNQQMVQKAFGLSEKTIYVLWLPLFHDMGLISVLQSLYNGTACVLMSPVGFLQKPLRWLQAISRYGATTSGGPNFAYDLCARKITAEQKANLDLSSWQVAFTGSEPIRAETLKRFSETFEPCGFRHSSFYPCYGMAEATLFITGGIKAQEPIIEWVEEQALQENKMVVASPKAKGTRALVGVGQTWLDQQICIVDPQFLRECPVGQVGEIWVAGASVAQGYWKQPEKTAETFQAYLATGEGPFLRTGDLGCVNSDGELFITGRIKDVIIIRGCNHYPQDIEKTVQQSNVALIPERGAAFALDVEGEEKLMVAIEVERRFHERRCPQEQDDILAEHRRYERRDTHIDFGFEVELDSSPIFEAIVRDIRQAVTAHHGLQVYGILLLRVGTIPKTSSGKVQRYACRQGFLDQSLTLVYSHLGNN